jgi:phosphoglycerate dehydrogenase-like enzyme
MLEQRFAVSLCPLEGGQTTLDPRWLSDADYVFGTWGMPILDDAFMAAAPKLKAIFYGAGGIKNFTPETFWKHEVRIFSAWQANAVPVAEFTFAQIILSLKSFWSVVQQTRERREWRRDDYCESGVPGGYRSTVGLLSLGQIGRRVAQRLKTLELKIIAYDPYMTLEQASKLGVDLVSLDDVFARSDVVSCHTPWLPETEKMLRYKHFNAMKPHATFINTARGAVVDEDDLIATLKERPDLTALLDVTYPEPPESSSPFYTLPNVIVTPHIAGSVNAECRRMGRWMIEEYDRMSNGESLLYEITRERVVSMA